ncbi:Rab family GTPase [uncultured Legionella sp.]|uniref:Rab family GTPase n=1 Tax=uncultured Legionella sp. TaxID=210934 RepID=UPI00261C65C7|nr:Rab family GTPase [uncultured Legionella sp.]
MKNKQEITRKYANYQPNLFKKPEYDMFKIGVLGSPETGKTSLMKRAANNEFSHIYSSTNFLHHVTIMKESEGAITELQLWELPPHQKWDSHTNGMHGMMILFDVTNPESFRDIKKHLKLVEERCRFGRDQIMLVGTKSDLVAERKISSDDVVEYAELMDMIYIDVSNKSGENVQDVLQILTEQLRQARREKEALARGDKMSGEPENKKDSEDESNKEPEYKPGSSCTIS